MSFSFVRSSKRFRASFARALGDVWLMEMGEGLVVEEASLLDRLEEDIAKDEAIGCDCLELFCSR